MRSYSLLLATVLIFGASISVRADECTSDFLTGTYIAWNARACEPSEKHPGKLLCKSFGFPIVSKRFFDVNATLPQPGGMRLLYNLPIKITQTNCRVMKVEQAIPAEFREANAYHPVIDHYRGVHLIDITDRSYDMDIRIGKDRAHFGSTETQEWVRITKTGDDLKLQQIQRIEHGGWFGAPTTFEEKLVREIILEKQPQD